MSDITLYGSIPSPYVRRIRMLLNGMDYRFVDMDIYAGADRDKLLSINPTGKIPMLEDGEQVIFDSRIIFNYLRVKLDITPLTWEQENQMTVVDAATESFVILLMLLRSDLDSSEDRLFYRLQKDRIQISLDELEQNVSDGVFDEWAYPSICLYTLLDWVCFRELYDLTEFPMLKNFMQKNAGRDCVANTDPRNSL